MEIITYVRKGAITHQDSKGNEGRTEAGDVQVMSAGTGIFHSEYNRESEDTTLYQIWIEPNQRDVEPRWDAHEFPKESEGLTLLVDGEGKAPLHINADAKIYAGRLSAGDSIKQTVSNAYLLISDGEIEIEGQLFAKGDAAEIDQQDKIDIQANSDSELILIDLS